MIDILLDNSGLLLTIAIAVAAAFGGALFGQSYRQQKEKELQAFICNMTDGYYRSSLGGKQLTANPALVRLNGYETEEEMLRSVGDISTEWYVDPSRRGEFQKALEENGFVEDFRSQIYRHKTREVIWISENAHLICDAQGLPRYYEGTVREITDTMRRLELESSYRKFSENVPGAMYQAKLDDKDHFTVPFFSSGFLDMFGCPNDVDLSKDATSLLRYVHKDDLARFLESSKMSQHSMCPMSDEFRIVRPDGTFVWLDFKSTPERLDDGSTLWHGFLMDVTDRKNTEKRVHDLAFYDPLTGLANRRLLLDRLKGALQLSRTASSFGAALFIDLDNFKILNDTRGHGRGDQLLVEIARRLGECTEDKGAVARFGGDEFVVLLSHLGTDVDEARDRAEELAKKILRAVDQPVEFEDGPFQTGCSIGVAMFGEKDSLAHEVLRHADTAMYDAKDSGKGTICFYDPGMLKKLDQSVSLMRDLRQAIPNGELNLHYQLQVAANGTLKGAEALLRWDHPTQGRIAPDQFIPLAEQSGIIVPVTQWALNRAFKTLQRWRDHDHLRDLKLSVNISARQFHEPDFVDQIKGLVVEHDIDASRLVLEMTEHVLTQNTVVVLSVMRELKKIGVCFSLDDFGTGYSSLVNMRDLPFDEVKIDGKFVAELENNSGDQAIVHSIIAMANALALETVAEWVETDAQRDYLSRAGCHTLQGYLFGPAVPISEFEELACGKRFGQAVQPSNKRLAVAV